MKKVSKKSIIISLLLGSYLLVTGCPRQDNNQIVKINIGDELKKVLTNEPNTKKVRSVTIFPDKVNLNIGESKKLTATIKYTDDTTDTSVSWDNPNSKVVAVSPDGTLVGLSSGQVTLTAIATRDAEKRFSLNVTVNSNKVVDAAVTPKPNEPIPATRDVKLGKAGYAIHFNGIDSFISVPDTDLLNVSTALTMESWVNISKFSESSEGAFFPVLLKGTQNVRYGIIINADNTVEIRLDNKKILIQDKAYSLKTWYHLAVSWDGATVSLYRNGVLSGSAPYQSEILSAGENTSLYLGADLSSREKFANGQLDNVRIWNYTLSQVEIRENMHLNLKGDEFGLVGYWKFDEGTGTSTADASAGKSKGNLINRSSWVVSTASILADKE